MKGDTRKKLKLNCLPVVWAKGGGTRGHSNTSSLPDFYLTVL